MSHQSFVTDRLLRLPAVRAMTGLARTSIYRAIAAPATRGGGFPRPVKLGRASAWPEAEVRDWIEQRKAERPAPDHRVS